MSRVEKTARLLTGNKDIQSVLDVGCRDGILMKYLPETIRYHGADLFPVGDHVDYVGDIMTMDFDETFDAVTAVDVLEHLDELHKAFDKLVGLSRKTLIVSLPNCYDLKSRCRFALKGHMGGKYKLSADATEDRHRWLLTYDDIIGFYRAKARQHDLTVTIHPVCYGEFGSKSPRGYTGRLLSACLPRALTAHSIVAEFRK